MTTHRKVAQQNYASRYLYDRMSQNADEAEWKAVVAGSSHVSAGTRDDMIAGATDDLIPDAEEENRLQATEMAEEMLQGGVAEICADRKKILGGHYPFALEGNSLVFDRTAPKIYSALLGICQAPSLTLAPHNELPILFERLCVHAGKAYLGSGAQGYRSGWPRQGAEPKAFKQLIERVFELSGRHEGEWHWSPGPDLDPDPTPRVVKELGMDVVAWKVWPDQRGGQLYMLGQCACGGDWLDKFEDLQLKRLADWARLPHVTPVRSFFTPRHAVQNMLIEASKYAGLVFDRARIVNQLAAANDAEINSIADRIVELAETELAPASATPQPAPKPRLAATKAAPRAAKPAPRAAKTSAPYKKAGR